MASSRRSTSPISTSPASSERFVTDASTRPTRLPRHRHRSARGSNKNHHNYSPDSSRETQHRRKKRRRHRPVDDWSSSSFAPLFVSDNDEQEESVLLALARADEQQQDDEQYEAEENMQPDTAELQAKKQQKATFVDPSTTLSDQSAKPAEKRGKITAKSESQANPQPQKVTEETLSSETKPNHSQQLRTTMILEELRRNTDSHQEINNHHVSANQSKTTTPHVVSNVESRTTLHTASHTTESASKAHAEQNTMQQHQQGTAVPVSPHAKSYSPPITPPRQAATAALYSHKQSHAPQASVSTHPYSQSIHDNFAMMTTPWVRRFVSSRPRDALLPISREYLADGFNLVQLAPLVERVASMDKGYAAALAQEQDASRHHTYPIFKAALQLILQQDEESTHAVSATVQRAAETLYTLVHARYVVSPRGLDTVRQVLQRRGNQHSGVDPVFGKCPRVACRGMPLLPLGDSEDYDPHHKVSTRAKRFCSCCGEKFYMWDSKVDQCAWGPSFCHLFLLTYGSDLFRELLQNRRRTADYVMSHSSSSVSYKNNVVAPTIFGFQLHPGSKLQYPISRQQA